jgi:hypothetical protein
MTSAEIEVVEVGDRRRPAFAETLPRGLEPTRAPGVTSETYGAIAHADWRIVVFPTPFSPRMTVHFAGRLPWARFNVCSGPKQRTPATRRLVK